MDKISPRFNPNDGIKESFFIPAKENNKIIVYVFIDEDSKKDGTTIFGEKKTGFEKLNEGIYFAKLKTNSCAINGKVYFSSIELKKSKLKRSWRLY